MGKKSPSATRVFLERRMLSQRECHLLFKFLPKISRKHHFQHHDTVQINVCWGSIQAVCGTLGMTISDLFKGF
jgi:hypothetical protein